MLINILKNGDIYNKWTVINSKEEMSGKRKMILCKCVCGLIRLVEYYSLINGISKSCVKCSLPANGLSRSRIYKIYRNIKSRCYNKNYTYYSEYGGRGIIMCNEWKDSFLCFYEWSMSNGYKEDLEIDRKNVNGNYDPFNCRWVTHAENMYNRRKMPSRSKEISSLYKGVSWDKRRKKWCAEIRKYKQKYFIGRFDNEEDAARAYDKKAKELFGEFANLNFLEI